MDDKYKPWIVGALVVVCFVGYFWWKQENPRLLDGDYRCEGRTNHPDGTSSAIDATAGVVGGKIQIGQTGADLAMGRTVMSWGKVEDTSRTEFLVEITPSTDISHEIIEPFWVTCKRE